MNLLETVHGGQFTLAETAGGEQLQAPQVKKAASDLLDFLALLDQF